MNARALFRGNTVSLVFTRAWFSRPFQPTHFSVVHVCYCFYGPHVFLFLSKIFFKKSVFGSSHRSIDFCRLCVRVFDRNSVNSMKFDDFIQCCVMLKSMTDAFKKYDNQQRGVIHINYEQV